MSHRHETISDLTLKNFRLCKMYFLFFIFFLFPEILEATDGMRQRNSTVPIRQVINRSRASMLLLRRNSTEVSDERCAVCFPETCNQRSKEELEDLFCVKKIYACKFSGCLKNL